MSSQTAPSVPNLNALMSSLQASAGTSIYNFLLTEVETTWNTMDAQIKAWISANAANNSGLRALISLPDGTVAYDSAKANNSFANFKSKTIDENHNSRLAILTAMLGKAGVGYETKYSTTTDKRTSYVAQRIGKSTEDSVGCCRVSILADL